MVPGGVTAENIQIFKGHVNAIRLMREATVKGVRTYASWKIRP
jgi:hypothetical protein